MPDMKPETSVKILKPEALAQKLNRWMEGDNGPFGWNDPAQVQDQFEAMTMADREKFIEAVVVKVRATLTILANDAQHTEATHEPSGCSN